MLKFIALVAIGTLALAPTSRAEGRTFKVAPFSKDRNLRMYCKFGELGTRGAEFVYSPKKGETPKTPFTIINIAEGKGKKSRRTCDTSSQGVMFSLKGSAGVISARLRGICTDCEPGTVMMSQKASDIIMMYGNDEEVKVFGEFA
jgi:hypothetical protein